MHVCIDEIQTGGNGDGDGVSQQNSIAAACNAVFSPSRLSQKDKTFNIFPCIQINFLVPSPNNMYG